MGEKRHNVNTIAEILIENTQSLKKNAQRFEDKVNEAMKTELKVDSKQAEWIHLERLKQEQAFLDELRALNKNRRLRLPNWMVVVLMLFTTILLSFSVYTWNKGEDYAKMKMERDFYLEKYQELKK
ncbi:hypothetical protein BZG02_20450 [Labilibaculum filiforme]|uniref:Uncharacterized protein n=1 Tax=Labilibaculum filiforme TaxID=1940526 RepID=A0A2N3HQ52_9BACT|nr:hypothetical protein [Labilibaculum filiforme]PKQ60182.1 hypothetical protein BZG02_20450 [Labilibaculum filiforme]